MEKKVVEMIGRSIKKARENSEISQKDLAEAAGVSPKTIKNWEDGITEPKVREIIKISSKLGVEISVLLGEEEDDKRKVMGKIRSAIDHLGDKEIESLNIVLEGLLIRNQSKKLKIDLERN